MKWMIGVKVGLAGLMLAAVSGCPTVPGSALVRVGHLSPDAPNVDVWVDGALALEDVPYETVSDYLPLPPGERNIQVTPAGDSSTVLIDATVNLGADVAYTVAARGLLGDASLAASVFVDDREPASGQSKVRFIHLGADAPGVDVAVTGGPVLFSNTEFPDNTAYLTVDSGTVDLEVRVAGTQDVALAVPGVVLMPDTNYTIFAIGLISDGSLAALPVVDTP